MGDEEVDNDPKTLVTEECRKTICAESWASYLECSVRVKTDPKLMNNPEAQCTAYYLDFFKCADACGANKLFSMLK